MAIMTGISSLSLYAGTISVSGTLSKKITTTTNTDAIIVRNCDGVPLDTIPSSAVENTKYEPYAKNGQTLRFIVTRLENPELHIITIDTNINSTNYNATSGQFSVDLTRNIIIESRYNYKVKIRISEDTYGSDIFEREYALAPAGSGSAFPVGSVIAYLGNSGNIAGMEANGWFKCAGQSIDGLTALSADEKTALKNVLGNSSNLPDLRGTFLRGLDESKGLDDDAGSRTGGESTTGVRSQQGESMRNHRHSGNTSTDGAHTHTGSTSSERWGGGSDDTGSGGNSAAENSGTHSHTLTINSAGSHDHSFTTSDAQNSSTGITPQAGNENRPDNIAVYWLIRGR
jgi:hypothetical protein